MSASLSSLSKPQLKGLLQSQIKKNLTIAVGLSLIAGFAMNLRAKSHKKKYAEFYKHYDAEADFERMNSLGLFQSGQSTAHSSGMVV